MSEYDGPCEAGCVSFHGGEKRHHPDCGYYPSSLTKLHADRIEELEAKLAAKEKLMLALAGDKIDLVSELAGVKGKLAKAVELAEEAFDFNIEDAGPRAWHSINDRIEELKGQ